MAVGGSSQISRTCAPQGKYLHSGSIPAAPRWQSARLAPRGVSGENMAVLPRAWHRSLTAGPAAHTCAYLPTYIGTYMYTLTKHRV